MNLIKVTFLHLLNLFEKVIRGITKITIQVLKNMIEAFSLLKRNFCGLNVRRHIKTWNKIHKRD